MAMKDDEDFEAMVTALHAVTSDEKVLEVVEGYRDRRSLRKMLSHFDIARMGLLREANSNLSEPEVRSPSQAIADSLAEAITGSRGLEANAAMNFLRGALSSMPRSNWAIAPLQERYL